VIFFIKILIIINATLFHQQKCPYMMLADAARETASVGYGTPRQNVLIR